MTTPAREFLQVAAEKSANLSQRKAIRRAIDHYDASARSGRARFADWEAARQRCHDIKWEALNHLDKYLLEFERNLKARGGQVFWAETAEDARRYVTDLATRKKPGIEPATRRCARPSSRRSSGTIPTSHCAC